MNEDPRSGELSRRRLLQVGAAGALAIGVAGSLSWLGRYPLRPGEAAIGLTEKGLSVARALTEALFPAEDGFPSGISLGVHQRLDEEAWASSALIREDIEGALGLIEHAPPLAGYFSRFTRLSLADRTACMDQLCRDRRRLVVAAASSIKQMLHLFYYAHPATWAGMAYAGPFVPDPRPHETSLRYAELLARATQGAR